MVMSFTNSLDIHEHGTYVSLLLSEESQRDLVKRFRLLGIMRYDDPYDFHCTVCYSRKPIPDVKHYIFPMPVHARVDKWDVFPTQAGGKCLVLRIESSMVAQIHYDIRQAYGATYDYPEYKPHVTVRYSYNKDEYPPPFYENFWLTFDRAEVKGIVPNFTPKD
jgi:2'-5' RNA ligase